MYYKKLFQSFLLLVCFIGFPGVTAAETHVSTDPPYETTIWKKEGSPYILEESISIIKNNKLIIEAGVTIMSASTTEGQDPHTIWNHGYMELRGTEASPVRIIGLGNIFDRGTSTITHASFDRTGLSLTTSTTTITSSVFTGNEIGIEARGSTVSISQSEIRDNETGIYSGFWSFSPPAQVRADLDEYGIGGAGDVVEGDPIQNHITIRDSVFENNTTYSIKNRTVNMVDARENWWGGTEGPQLSTTGLVVTEPWKIEDPRIKKISCCSNVLFLPGFEGSRLYRDDKDLLGSGTTTHRAWEPFTKNDVKSLSMDTSGKSINSTIHTKDILGSAYGIVGIYDKFVAMMNGVVAEKVINEWLPFAYDWRLSMEDVALGETQYSTTTKRLIEEVERLAENSKTGKVTLLAHSYGGLIAKTLGKELERLGKSNLVDKVLLVAVPQLGTPQAIAGMLHGADQALGKGFIVKADVMRKFGLTTPGAYGLLPSRDYFLRITQPVIDFAGKGIESYEAFTDFLMGKNDNRSQPKDADLKSPAVLSSTLISKAVTAHTHIDSWKFPPTTEVMSLAGWGMPTTQSLEYGSSSPRVRKNPHGDSTVVSGSATAYWGEYNPNTVFFNLGLFNKETKKNISHVDILNAQPLHSFLSKIVATSSLAAVTNTLPTYLTQGKPVASDYPWMKWYTVSVHSPVDLDIYDSHGGHMGFIPIPGNEDSDVMLFENTIGGQYDAIGDEKYFTIPVDDTYTIQLKGTGVGSFTYQVQKFVGEDMTEVANIVYADLPVTPLLVASTTLSAGAMTTPLHLDVDGNGTVDIKTLPAKVGNPLLHLDAMKTILLSLHLKPALEKNFLHKLERIRTMIEKDKKGKVVKKIQTIVTKLDNKHWNIRKLTEAQKKSLSDMFETLLASLETL